MSTSVRMKPAKKQPALSPHTEARTRDRELEKAIMLLEDVCIAINEGDFTHGKYDEDRLYWQQRLKNIAKPISLALNEYKGPRVFHQHYRHKDGEENATQPVHESPLVQLKRTCERALAACEAMVGAKGTQLREYEQKLERCLRGFLATA